MSAETMMWVVMIDLVAAGVNGISRGANWSKRSPHLHTEPSSHPATSVCHLPSAANLLPGDESRAGHLAPAAGMTPRRG